MSHPIPLADAIRVWAKIAALSFGGPAGQIALMHRLLVEEKRLPRASSYWSCFSGTRFCSAGRSGATTKRLS